LKFLVKVFRKLGSFKFFESVCLYKIKRENPFEGSLLVCEVAKIIVFTSEWEVWKRFLQGVVSFSSVKNLFLKVSRFSNESVCKIVF
jgi:hypothetical protein